MNFLVNVLRPRRPLTTKESEFVSKNCTEVQRLGIYLFEGDFELFADDELVAFELIRDDLMVPSLGGLSDEALGDLVRGAEES